MDNQQQTYAQEVYGDTLEFRLDGTKVNGENEVSCCAPDKVRYQSLKFDCKCYITPLLFLFNYNIALLGVIYPHLFLSRPSEILKYQVNSYQEHFA